MYYDFIFKEMSNVRVYKKLSLLVFVVSKIGLFNTLFYNYITILDNILYNLLSNKNYSKIKKLAIKVYLPKIEKKL